MRLAIVAGGKGTRLGGLVRAVPKPLLEVGGRPLVEHQIRLAARHGIDRVALFIGHLGDRIREFCGDGSRFGVEISYFEERKPLGTAGCLRAAADFLGREFLVFYGDVMLDLDLDRLVGFHRRRGGLGTLVVHPNDHPFDSDLVEMDDDDRVTAILSKPHPQGLVYRNLVNAAVYVFNGGVLDELEEDRAADFGRDVLPALLARGRPLYGYLTSEYVKDMGTPRRLARVDADVRAGKPARRNLARPQRAIFLDRDGTVNAEVNLLHRPEQLRLLPRARQAIRRLNRSDFLAILVTNQPVVARNLCTLDGLAEIHRHLETRLGAAGAYLDAIYFCPHHPHRGYPEENPVFKIDCECRKPKPGMLLAAARRFNLSLADSFLVGDDERDMGAARAAGVTGLQIGEQVVDLAAAVDRILGPQSR